MNKVSKKTKSDSTKSKPSVKASIPNLDVEPPPTPPPPPPPSIAEPSTKDPETPSKTSTNGISPSPSLSARTIEVSVKALGNISSRYPGEAVRIDAEFGANFKASTTSPVVLAAAGTTAVQWRFSVPFFQHNATGRAELIAHPLLFTLYEHPARGDDVTSDVSSTSRTASKQSVTSTTTAAPLAMFGRCNLDLLPFILGETTLKTVLTVQQAIDATADDVIPWAHLPNLYLTAEVQEPVISATELGTGNLLSITLESLYNALPTMSPSCKYLARTPLPGGDERVTFDRGSYREVQDRNCVRRWMTLADVEGRGSGHGKRLGGELTDNALPEAVEKALRRDSPRVEWNFSQRFWLSEQSAEHMYNNVSKYRVWPLEIAVTSPTDDQRRETLVENLVAYVDVSGLLRPGVTRARVVGQVVKHSQEEMETLCGINRSMFHGEAFTADPNDETKDTESKRNGKNNLAAKRNRPLAVTKPPSPLESTASSMDVSDESPRPWSSEPMFVIFEVELWKPLTAKRIAKELHIDDLLPTRPKLLKHVMGACLSTEHYQRCLEAATSIITSEYCNFQNRHTHELKCDLCADEDAFYPYLVVHGAYQKIKETLRHKIVSMVNERLIEIDTSDMETFIQDVYTHVIEEMRAHIDKLAQRDSTSTDPQRNLRFYAEEAMEEYESDVARQLYAQRIANDVRNADVWLEYGVFCALDDVDIAMECIKEALSLDKRHLLGVFMYAMFLSMQKKYDQAEMCFHVLLALYPDFTEGWVTLHLFYLKQGSHDAADVALKTAWDAPLSYRRNSDVPLRCIDNVSLSWTSGFFPNTSIFMCTAELLLKLHVPSYSEMALAQELIHNNTTLGYWYYLGVNEYLNERFESALGHLLPYTSAGCQYHVIWALAGHCHYRLSNTLAATECYEKANSFLKPPHCSGHLVNLRLGDCYMSNMLGSGIRSAKKSFSEACEASPSPKSWLYFGVACYKLQEVEEAEAALLQANRLSNECPIILTYLSLVYLKVNRDTESAACFRCVI